jgi:nucleoside-diphosphate-sugar epimerase
MRVLITGVMGYVGSVLARHLRERFKGDVELLGYDTGFFADVLTGADRFPEVVLDRLYFGDIREFPEHLLQGVDAVVHLAAISNDPMGARYELVTEAINDRASVRLAQIARDQGIRHFVFASSCSIYGFAEGRPRRESDTLNPLTAYARSKVAVENALRTNNFGNMTVTCLRFATACGMSDRLRLDLVLNDFAASAIATGQIAVLSDGTPWRPLIDVSDMARAIEWAIQRSPDKGGRYLAVNAGSNSSNYQVCDLAEAVAAVLPDIKVNINTEAPPDKRSYQVDFLLFNEIAPAHQPQMSLSDSVMRLCAGLKKMNFADTDFRSSRFVRLRVLEQHARAGRLSEDLRWRL